MMRLYVPKVPVRFVLFGTLSVLVAAGVVYYLLFPHEAPWEPSGSLVVAVRAVPLPNTNGTTLGLGIDDLTLLRTGGERNQVSLLTRRFTLDPASPTLRVLLDTDAPVGTYTGLSFRLTSPELRNPWQGDDAPGTAALRFEHVSIPAPFSVSEGEVTILLLGFETFDAIHASAPNDIYLPVIQVELRQGAGVERTQDATVRVTDGRIETIATYGMDWTGAMRQNYRAKGADPSILLSETTATNGAVVSEQAPAPEIEGPEKRSSEARSDLLSEEGSPLEDAAESMEQKATSSSID